MLLPLPDDFHAHLRQGELMPGYVRDLASQFGRAIIMPNTVPAMTSAKAISEYKKQILEAAKDVRPDFEPLMTFKLNPNYTEQDLKDMMAVGVVAGKYYPAGVTTNSADGISDFEAVFPVVAMMEKLGLVLCVHGEDNHALCQRIARPHQLFGRHGVQTQFSALQAPHLLFWVVVPLPDASELLAVEVVAAHIRSVWLVGRLLSDGVIAHLCSRDEPCAWRSAEIAFKTNHRPSVHPCNLVKHQSS